MGADTKHLGPQTLLGNPGSTPDAPNEILLGTGLSFSGNIIVSSGGSGSGTVTSIIAGTGLTGGTITSTGTIALSPTGLTITQHTATIGVATVAAGATTLDATAKDKWIATLVNGTPTAITISGMVAGQTLSLSLLQDSTGSCTATYALSSGSLKWAGGSAPTLTTGANKGDKLVFDCVATGVVWGMIAGQNF